MENNQTAVEWFYDILTSENWEYKTFEEQDEIFKKAKQMEKDQIIDSFGVGCQVESTRLIGYQDIAEQYYNETYGKDSNADPNRMG